MMINSCIYFAIVVVVVIVVVVFVEVLLDKMRLQRIGRLKVGATIRADLRYRVHLLQVLNQFD